MLATGLCPVWQYLMQTPTMPLSRLGVKLNWPGHVLTLLSSPGTRTSRDISHDSWLLGSGPLRCCLQDCLVSCSGAG